MGRFIIIVLAGFIQMNAAWGQASDLFISEYVEGSSNNKYIEIYNGTGASVNLSNYELRLFANGSATPTTTSALSGTLANGAVIVYKNSSATVYTGTATALGAISFNGDDAIALYKVSTASYVDIFGNIGCDPGTSWAGSGVSTVDKSLVRINSVCGGITTNPGGNCPFPTVGTEWTQYNTDDVSNLGTHTANCSSCTSASEPTTSSTGISFSNVGCYQLTLSWTSGNGASRIVIARQGSAVSALPADNTVYTASNIFSNGSAVAPGEYVVYNGTGNTVTVSGLSTNTTYYFAIYEYNGTGCPTSGENYFTTSWAAGNQLTGTCTINCPWLTGAIINSCDGTCSEGDNEILFYNSGSYNIPVTPSNIIVTYGNSNPPTTTYTDAFTSNQTYVNNLNTTANCGTLFYDAYSVGMIPSNTSFMIMSPNACYNYDFSAFCNSGPVYILFTDDASWTASGNFANSTTCSGGTRYFRSDFSAVNSGCVNDAQYSCSGMTGTDGDYVTWGPSGGSPSAYIDEDCSFNSSSVLPISLIYFTGERNGNKVLLEWGAYKLPGQKEFHLERSFNGKDFQFAATLPVHNTQEIIGHYSHYDFPENGGPVYYRLVATEPEQTTSYSQIIVVKANESGETTCFYSNGYLNFTSDYRSVKTIQVFDLQGRLLSSQKAEGKSGKVWLELKPGCYIATITDETGMVSSIISAR